MGVMSEIHASACTTIYDILKNRLSLPEEESTYELAVDIFEAIVDDLEVMNVASAKILKAYETKLDNELSIIRDLYDEDRYNKYLLGYFTGIQEAATSLSIMKLLTGGDGGDPD